MRAEKVRADQRLLLSRGSSARSCARAERRLLDGLEVPHVLALRRGCWGWGAGNAGSSEGGDVGGMGVASGKYLIRGGKGGAARAFGRISKRRMVRATVGESIRGKGRSVALVVKANEGQSEID